MLDLRALTVPGARGGDEGGGGGSRGDGPINEDDGGGMSASEELEAMSSTGAVGGAWGLMETGPGTSIKRRYGCG